MPFVLCPLLWSRYSEQSSEEIEPTGRAHGDGLEVSGTSPEAFEEMIWKHFRPEHYRDDRIRPWRTGDEQREFDSFFRTHMRKVIAVRQAQHGEQHSDTLRYLSRNNLNIARLAAPPEGLQEGAFLIPFRDPVQQAASMHRQHERFLEIHEDDDFVRVYMEAIGRHEFGERLKPVNFKGWLDEDPANPADLEFWLQYWNAAYQFILKHAGERGVLVSYARFTEQLERSLALLAREMGLPEDVLVSQAEELRAPRTHSVDRDGLSDSLLEVALSVYDRLDERASL